MGRPLNKRWFGSLDDTDGDTMPVGTADNEYNIRVEAYVGGASVDDAYILAQKGTNKFKVSNKAGTETAICRLANISDGSLSDGEMVAFGYLAATGEKIILQKLFNRTVVDWSGNRYVWEIQEDSTETVMVLTEI